MSRTDQMYCTHCTYGSSAVERAAGHSANEVLGYSARASTLSGRDVGAAYHQFNAWLAYALPRGTPPAANLTTRPEKAPRAVFYTPQAGPFEAMGQVCHRETDATGRRPGSYFGHILFRDTAGGRKWTALDALRLYAAPGWVVRDDPAIPHQLSTLAAPGDLQKGGRGCVDEQLLLSYLTAPRGAPLDDPGRIVPARWRKHGPQTRADILTRIMAGFLSLRAGPGRAVFLVAESDFAALLYFGLLRLLPPAATVGVSVLTYDVDPTRRRATLGATTYFDPEADDLPAGFYGDQATFVFNTFTKRTTDRPVDESFAREVVEKLATGGWAAADEFLARVSPDRTNVGGRMEAAATSLAVAAVLLDPGAPPVPPAWRDDAGAARFIAAELISKLGGAGRLAWPPALRGTHQDQVLECLACAGDVMQPNTRALAEAVPDERLAALLTCPGVTEPSRRGVLDLIVRRGGRLPPSAMSYWAANAADPQSPLGSLVDRLDAAALARLAEELPPQAAGGFLERLLAAPQPAKRALARQLTPRFGPYLAGDALVSFLLSDAGAEYLDSSSSHPYFNAGVRRLLGELHTRIGDRESLETALKSLGRARRLLGPDAGRLEAWDDLLTETDRLPASAASNPGGQVPTAIFRAWVKAFDRAVPGEVVGDVNERFRLLQRLAGQSGAGEELFGPGDWDGAIGFLKGQGWMVRGVTDTIAVDPRRHAHEPPPFAGRFNYFIAGGLAALVLAAVLWWGWSSWQPAQQPLDPTPVASTNGTGQPQLAPEPKPPLPKPVPAPSPPAKVVPADTKPPRANPPAPLAVPLVYKADAAAIEALLRALDIMPPTHTVPKPISPPSIDELRKTLADMIQVRSIGNSSDGELPVFAQLPMSTQLAKALVDAQWRTYEEESSRRATEYQKQIADGKQSAEDKRRPHVTDIRVYEKQCSALSTVPKHEKPEERRIRIQQLEDAKKALIEARRKRDQTPNPELSDDDFARVSHYPKPVRDSASTFSVPLLTITMHYSADRPASRQSGKIPLKTLKTALTPIQASLQSSDVMHLSLATSYLPGEPKKLPQHQFERLAAPHVLVVEIDVGGMTTINVERSVERPMLVPLQIVVDDVNRSRFVEILDDIGRAARKLPQKGSSFTNVDHEQSRVDVSKHLSMLQDDVRRGVDALNAVLQSSGTCLELQDDGPCEPPNQATIRGLATGSPIGDLGMEIELVTYDAGVRKERFQLSDHPMGVKLAVAFERIEVVPTLSGVPVEPLRLTVRPSDLMEGRAARMSIGVEGQIRPKDYALCEELRKRVQLLLRVRKAWESLPK